MKQDAAEVLVVGNAAVPRHELRVLRGVHAGARTFLEQAEGQLSIGSTVDNDIILRDGPDLPSRAVLMLKAHGWIWASDGGANPVSLVLGNAVRFGSAVITVDEVQAPWPNLETLAIELDASEAKEPDTAVLATGHSEAQSESAAMAITDSADPQMFSSPSEGTSSTQADQTRAKTYRTRVWARLSILLWVLPMTLVTATIWMLLSLLLTPATQAAMPVHITPILTADTVRNVISSLGLSASVKVLETKGRGLEVIGVVASETQRDELRAGLMALEPVPSSAVLTQSEFSTEVQALSRTLDVGLKLSVKGLGKVLVSGVASEHQEVDALSHHIAFELPSAIYVEKAVKIPPEIVAEFNGELAQLGLPMRAKWKDGQMLIDGILTQDRVAHWEDLLLRFNKQYGEHIPFFASLDEGHLSGDMRSAPSPAQSPFGLIGIDSVIGGDAPYVVLADGQIVSIGGILNGYELVAIRNDILVLKDGQGSLQEVLR